MEIKVEVDDYSLIPLFIEMYLNEGSKPIAIGTCFSIEIKHQSYLITNWHNVTGRNPQTDNPISPGGIPDPDILKVWFFTNTIGLWIQKTIRLKNSDKKSWIEHPKGKEVDVVAIPYVPSPDIIIKNLDIETANKKIKLYPSKAVSIIGYPFGLTSGGKFPIWKKGHIASEYNLDFNNQPVFLIDATTRNGMSGAPVILRESGLIEYESNRLASGTATRFLGVYSGRINDQSEIGKVWKPSVISEIISAGIDSDLLPGEQLT